MSARTALGKYDQDPPTRSAVSGWIKFEKELLTDPRVLKIASRLCHAEVTPGHAAVTALARNRLTVLGALITLWSFADTHIGEDNTLESGKEEIDALIGITGFCELMPRDWLQVIDAERIELPGFLIHNGIAAKKRSLAQKRQQKHRANGHAPVTPPSRSRHASVARAALPDRDRDRDKDLDRDRDKDLDRESRKEGEAPTPSNGKRKHAEKTQLPEDFALTPELEQYAIDRLPSVDPAELLASFRGKAQAKGWEYANWRQAFQEFIRNASPKSGHFAAGQYPRANGRAWE